MGPVRIVCVGNRLIPRDSLGPLVHDVLAGRSLPAGVEAVDGGLRGLDLARLVEGSSRVVFVDAVAGCAAPGRVVILSGEEATRGVAGGFGHSSGLGFLLRALPVVCEGRPPAWVVVGAEGEPDGALVARVADRAVELAIERGEGHA